MGAQYTNMGIQYSKLLNEMQNLYNELTFNNSFKNMLRNVLSQFKNNVQKLDMNYAFSRKSV